MIMAFDTLQSLGEEKFRTLVQKLLGGTRESLVATLIRQQWGDCQDISENTLVEELKALHEAASIKTRAIHEQGDVGGDDNSFLQLRDSRLGCLERLIHAAISTENGIDSIVKDGRLTDSESRKVIALIKLNMQQIAMIQVMKLNIGLDAYKRGMSAEEIDTSNRWEFEEKMKWINAERRVQKWLKLNNITGEEDAEDFLRRYHAKYGGRQESRTNHESASSSSLPPSAMSDKVGQEQRDEAISAAGWDLLERLESHPKQPWQ
jgi:hypothetical protein